MHTALGGTLSSYTWICLILNFLQTRNPPILPSLHTKPHLRRPSATGKPTSFDDDLDRLRGFGEENKETLGELLFHFFRRYAYDLDYEKNVISVREGKLISKEGKKWHLMQNNRLCVEEPFNTERNLGNTADDTSFRGIHLELRRAFDFVKDAMLDQCLEEYVFPATEERIWEKPVSRPPPVLTRSRSQSQSSRGRGGYGTRGGNRHGQNNQRTSGRRSSSAATFNKFTLPQINMQGVSGRDHASRDHLQAQYEQLQLHHELFNKFQVLQAQEHELRLLQAQTQLHAQMQAQGSAAGSSFSHQQAMMRDQHRASLSNHVPLTDPLHSGAIFQSFQYPQVPGTPHQSVHTQPSSPSIKPIQPDLRRSLHRTSVAENPSASNRSHSQPARPFPPSIAAQRVPPVPANNYAFQQYQQHLRHQQLYGALDVTQGRQKPSEMPIYQDLRRMPTEQHFDESVPKEYVGYWVNDSPPQRGYREDHTVPRVPTYQDLHPQVRGMAPSFSRLRDASRSPSPSPMMPLRDRSFSVRSASSAPPQPAQSRFERAAPSMLAPRQAGSVLPNGNNGWTIPDYSAVADTSSHTTTISETTSGSDDRQHENTASVEAETLSGRGPDDGVILDDTHHYFHAQTFPESSRLPLRNRNENLVLTPRNTGPHAGDVAVSPTTTYGQDIPNKHSGGLGIQFGEHEIRRPSFKAEEKTSPKSARSAVAVPVSEPKSEQKPPLPVPLLSPVREVRTPSPTAKRREDAPSKDQRPYQRSDFYIPPFAELVRAKQERHNNASAQKANGAESFHLSGSTKSNQPLQMSPTSQPSSYHRVNGIPDESLKPALQNPQINGWQQQSSKKGKKNRSRPSSGQLSVEQMPANEAERKGG